MNECKMLVQRFPGLEIFTTGSASEGFYHDETPFQMPCQRGLCNETSCTVRHI